MCTNAETEEPSHEQAIQPLYIDKDLDSMIISSPTRSRSLSRRVSISIVSNGSLQASDDLAGV